MSYGKIDLNDGVVSPFFVIASGVEAGLFEFSPYGVDFSSAIIDFGSQGGLSIASMIAIAALLVAYYSNSPDFSKMGAVQTWIVIVTIVLVISQPVVPLLSGLIGASVVIGTVALIIQSSGFYALAYLG